MTKPGERIAQIYRQGDSQDGAAGGDQQSNIKPSNREEANMRGEVCRFAPAGNDPAAPRWSSQACTMCTTHNSTRHTRRPKKFWYVYPRKGSYIVYGRCVFHHSSRSRSFRDFSDWLRVQQETRFATRTAFLNDVAKNVRTKIKHTEETPVITTSVFRLVGYDVKHLDHRATMYSIRDKSGRHRMRRMSPYWLYSGTVGI